MKQQSKLSQALPAFKIELNTLQELVDDISREFSKKPDIHFSLKVKSEEFEFENTEDLQKNANRLPFVLRNIFLSWSEDWDKRCSISVDNASSYGWATVSASATSKGWCAGVVKIVTDFAGEHRQWFSWPHFYKMIHSRAHEPESITAAPEQADALPEYAEEYRMSLTFLISALFNISNQ